MTTANILSKPVVTHSRLSACSRSKEYSQSMPALSAVSAAANTNRLVLWLLGLGKMVVRFYIRYCKCLEIINLKFELVTTAKSAY